MTPDEVRRIFKQEHEREQLGWLLWLLPKNPAVSTLIVFLLLCIAADDAYHHIEDAFKVANISKVIGSYAYVRIKHGVTLPVPPDGGDMIVLPISGSNSNSSSSFVSMSTGSITGGINIVMPSGTSSGTIFPQHFFYDSDKGA